MSSKDIRTYTSLEISAHHCIIIFGRFILLKSKVFSFRNFVKVKSKALNTYINLYRVLYPCWTYLWHLIVNLFQFC